jgi:peptide/nickel transport system substrate-binding protein/oligopeptide transport system substrate-binding protein
VEIRFLGEDETDFGARLFLERKLDLFEPATESLPRLAAEPRVRLHRYQELSISFLGLNGSVPPLDRLWLRRAIAHAIDRQGMIDESPEVRREASGILPPGIPGFSPEAKGLAHDPREARRILAEAGHPGGAGLPPVRICNPSMGPAAQRVLQRITADLEAVGIRVEVLPVSWAELGEMLDERTAPAFLLAWIADRTDPDAFLRELFASEGSANYFAYSSETVDELLDRGVVERDPQRRAMLYRQAEREVLVDAPLIPLYHTVGILAVHRGVRGLEPTPLGLAKAELENVWLEQREDDR